MATENPIECSRSKQQRVGEVHQAEERENGNHTPERRWKRCEGGRIGPDGMVGLGCFPGLQCGSVAPRVVHECYQCDAQHGRNHGDPQEWADLVIEGLVRGEPYERADHRAERIHRPVKAERLAPLGRDNTVSDERVTGRPAQPLAEPVDTPGDEDGWPSGGQRNEQLSKCSQAVACGYQGLAAHPVRSSAGERRHDRTDAVGQAFDAAEDRRWRTEDNCDEGREDRVDQLARRVLEE
jgi:hypothetical protein